MTSFTYRWSNVSYPSGSLSLSDTGKLVVFGVEADDGAVNFGGYDR